MEENKNQSTKSYILGISIVLAALVLGIMMVCTVKTLKSYDDTVKVRGLCEKEVPADRVVWRISYSEKDNDLAALRGTMERNDRAIIALLKERAFSVSALTPEIKPVLFAYSN